LCDGGEVTLRRKAKTRAPPLPRRPAALHCPRYRRFRFPNEVEFHLRKSFECPAISFLKSLDCFGRGDDILPGLRVLHVARDGRRGWHFLIYRTSGDRNIEILRMLHDGIDFERHFR
jgi:hypothetical protein